VFSWLFRTETEKKRDNYYDLYKSLQDALKEHNRKVAQAEASYSSYIGSVPSLSNFKIPSNDFDPKREELSRKLNKHFNEEKQKRSELDRASNQAYQRYIYYKNLAIREAEAKAEKERREREERRNGSR
jgi:hypothetical protein